MPVITRPDGVTFIAQAYRESLKAQDDAALMETLQALAVQHGDAVCLRRTRQHTVEAAFSKTSGYLLGESVWQYLKRPSHLIYVEGVSNSAQLLVVIVRSGRVYFDAKITSSELKTELLSVMSDDVPYRVVTYGDVPVRVNETFGGATFTLPKQLIASFETLEQPLFPMLPCYAGHQLSPIAAIDLSATARPKRRWAVVSIIAVLMLSVGAWVMFSHRSTSFAKNTHGVSAMLAKLPEPRKQLLVLMRELDALYLVPGWQVTQVRYVPEAYQIRMQSIGGTLSYLAAWAKRHHADFQLLPHVVELVLPFKATVRDQEQTLLPMTQVLENLMDRLHAVLAEDKVSIVKRSAQKQWQKTVLLLRLQSASPEHLALIGGQLQDLPVAISSMRLNTENGLIQGKIYLSVWGR